MQQGHQESRIDLMRENAELKEALASVIALARVKWGNLDAEANTVFDRAEALLA